MKFRDTHGKIQNSPFSVAQDRRRFLKGATLALGVATTGALWSRRSFAITESELYPTAPTAHGKIRGFNNHGIMTFKGVSYAESTAGKNRFMPPVKLQAWKGVREAIDFGHIAPQLLSDPLSDYGKMIFWDQQPGGMSEDCLVLNVWTPALDGKKRPVMVSFHGGGYTTGSGNQFGFDGDSLARFGDVVVVTVNHRLGALGYLNLAELGGPKQSGVAGIMDLVASLEWVRDNIENFGGNPHNVTIFGQSGGGAKASVMLAVPSAKGLFHRAVVQSGSALRAQTAENGTKAAEKFLAELGIPKGDLAALQKVPFTKIIAAQTTLERQLPPTGFSPIVDGSFLPHNPFDPTAPMESADVPLIVSSTMDEAALFLTDFNLDEAGLKAVVEKMVPPERAQRVLQLYRREYPDASPYLLHARMLTDRSRGSAILQAERKAALGRAPAYMYLLEWQSPGDDGKFGAVHGTDVSLSFHDWRGPITGSGGREGKIMADRISSALVAFARNGNPNNPALPHWPTYDAKTRATMVFNIRTRVENDPRREFMDVWK